jgi:hypothetical protein
MPRDSGEIDTALITRLQTDAVLGALMPGGVYYGRAAAGQNRFVIVSNESGFDEVHTFGPPGERSNFERRMFLIKAVEQGPSTTNTRQAADRIRELLEDHPLVITGFVACEVRRAEYIRYAEPDEVDTAIVWQHRGGRYRIVAAPVPAGN